MSTPRGILFVGFDGAQSLDFIGPLEVFSGANQLVGDAFSVTLASPAGGRITSSSGLRIETDVSLSRCRRPIDTLIVAGGEGARTAAEDPKVKDAVVALASRSRRVASVCTGAFVLANAGLLDGRRATTHWAYCGKLAEQFPTVTVEHDPIFVRDGNVWTSAEVTAGMDLALAMVEDDLGSAVSLEIARHLVLFVRRPGGQSQFSAQLRGQLAQSDVLRDLQLWILENLSDDLRVEILAMRVAMSVRNFTRVFRREVGSTPAHYVEAARIEAGRRLLETTRLALEQVALACGFASADVFRRAFTRRLGTSPRAYRGRFSSSNSEHNQWRS